MKRAGLHCNCGQAITHGEVKGVRELVRIGRRMVHIAWRCGHCGRLGEQFVESSKWDPACLEPVAPGFRFGPHLALTYRAYSAIARRLRAYEFVTAEEIAEAVVRTAVCDDERGEERIALEFLPAEAEVLAEAAALAMERLKVDTDLRDGDQSSDQVGG